MDFVTIAQTVIHSSWQHVCVCVVCVCLCAGVCVPMKTKRGQWIPRGWIISSWVAWLLGSQVWSSGRAASTLIAQLCQSLLLSVCERALTSHHFCGEWVFTVHPLFSQAVVCYLVSNLLVISGGILQVSGYIFQLCKLSMSVLILQILMVS
jgi:hypothetical protein